MVKRKASVTEDDEHFVLNTKSISKTTKKTVEIHDFISKIEDEDNKMKAIISPLFKLAGVDFSIDVLPDKEGSGFTGVFLYNCGDEDQMTSSSIKEFSGEEGDWTMDKIKANQSWGFPEFMSHEKYRQFAKVHGDVLKLEVVLTLHTKAEGDGWTR